MRGPLDRMGVQIAQKGGQLPHDPLRDQTPEEGVRHLLDRMGAENPETGDRPRKLSGEGSERMGSEKIGGEIRKGAAALPRAPGVAKDDLKGSQKNQKIRCGPKPHVYTRNTKKSYNATHFGSSWHLNNKTN